MNDAEYERVKGLVADYIKWWTRELGLGFWNITVAYHRAGWDGSENDDTWVAMDCAADWRYLRTHLRVNVHGIWNHDCTEADIERYVIHELCHCLVNELGAEVRTKRFGSHRAHEERVVSMLTNAFVWVRQHAEDPVPKDEDLTLLSQKEAHDGGDHTTYPDS